MSTFLTFITINLEFVGKLLFDLWEEIFYNLTEHMFCFVGG